MGFKCGIVGLPNVGKSTIFNALTAARVASANYPFCTIEPNVGQVLVPDPRLAVLNKYTPAQRIVPATMEFVDIAGLVRGAAKGEGLGNQFLGHIRSTDATAHIVRCFESTDIVHVEGGVDPLRDIDTINTELIYADHDTVENTLKRVEKLVKTGDKKVLLKLAMLKALHEHLSATKPARSFALAGFVADEIEVEQTFCDLHLITAKPVLYVCNVGEESATTMTHNNHSAKVAELAAREGAEFILVCGKLEEEISELEPAAAQEMLAELGIKEPGLHQLIRAGYKLLGLQTYFTAGEKEIRAWTIHRGDKAPAAAGKIHSDFERGFICAEVFTIPDLERAGARGRLKDLGLLRTEGKEYVVQDGDVMEFRFNV